MWIKSSPSRGISYGKGAETLVRQTGSGNLALLFPCTVLVWMSCAVEAAGRRRGLRPFSGHAEEHGGVFENRIEDRKPLRVLSGV
jgi:hypothetical protein